MTFINKSKVLYITGRGGDHKKGLGGYISKIVTDYDGISVDVPFLRQDLDDQLVSIRKAIAQCSGGTVIANSYGAYLTLLSLIDFDHDAEQVVLLSPVLGRAIAKDRMYLSRPPATIRIRNAVQERTLRFPKKTSIYIGDKDELYDPELLSTYADLIGEERIYVLEGQQHNIDKDFMENIIKAVLMP